VRQQQYPGVDIVVADSAPVQADASAVAAQFGAHYVYLDRPGVSRACNRGAKEATGEIVVFLDDDVIVDKGCFVALIEEFSDSRTMAVTGRILMYGGDPKAKSTFESFGGFDPGPDRRVIDRGTPHWFELANFGGLGTGAMIALRRTAYESWSGFDERLGRGSPQDCFQENKAYFSLVELGHRVVYTPKAVARHPAPASLDELRYRVLNNASAASAYMTLLLFEFPTYRWEVLQYAWEAIRGQQREWRPKAAMTRYSLVPRWRERAAWLMGPLLYLRMRLKVAAAALGIP
jgi:cellulose synthase/poly-beta-1,6-N-acetylglucosamine synthase-like glycosyltransferase